MCLVPPATGHRHRADAAKSADRLTQWQVGHEELADGTLMVPPEEANGTLLYLVAR